MDMLKTMVVVALMVVGGSAVAVQGEDGNTGKASQTHGMDGHPDSMKIGDAPDNLGSRGTARDVVIIEGTYSVGTHGTNQCFSC